MVALCHPAERGALNSDSNLGPVVVIAGADSILSSTEVIAGEDSTHPLAAVADSIHEVRGESSLLRQCP